MPTKSNQAVKQEIILVIDKSGSMGSSRDDVVGGFNTYVSDLKKEKGIDAKLTLVMFDDNVHKLYAGKAIAQVGELCNRTYCPGGSTSLNDAVMEAIEDAETRLNKSKAKNKPQVMVIVFTDGEENASSKFGGDVGKDKVKQKRAEKEQEGWAFIFMGADMDAWAAGGSYGMSAGNTLGLGKQAIGQTMSYLSNRTAKAARMHSANISGELSNVMYAQSMSNIMALDEDDLANDEVAVALRGVIDQSTKTQPSAQNIFGNNSIPVPTAKQVNPLYSDLIKKAKAAVTKTPEEVDSK